MLPAGLDARPKWKKDRPAALMVLSPGMAAQIAERGSATPDQGGQG